MTEEPQGSREPEPITSAALFLGLCNLRVAEGTLRWQGASLGFLLNLPGLGFVTLKLADVPAVKELIFLALGSLLCCALNWFLHQVIRRDGRYMDLWNDLLAEVEKVNGTEGGVKVFSSDRHVRLRESRGRLQNRLQALVIGGIVAWGVLSVFSLGMIFGVK